jgi:hypothetical protein
MEYLFRHARALVSRVQMIPRVSCEQMIPRWLTVVPHLPLEGAIAGTIGRQ